MAGLHAEQHVTTLLSVDHGRLSIPGRLIDVVAQSPNGPILGLQVRGYLFTLEQGRRIRR
jgi:hypothetical protein